MLTSDGNEKCKKKKSIGLKSEKKLCTQCSTFFCTFLCHCFAVRLQRTLNFLVARFMEEKSYTGRYSYVPFFFFTAAHFNLAGR